MLGSLLDNTSGVGAAEALLGERLPREPVRTGDVRGGFRGRAADDGEDKEGSREVGSGWGTRRGGRGRRCWS